MDHLEVAVSKIDSNGQEKGFGNITLQRFALAFALAKFDMQVDVSLRSLLVIMPHVFIDKWIIQIPRNVLAQAEQAAPTIHVLRRRDWQSRQRLAHCEV